jgi:hypothetical protein
VFNRAHPQSLLRLAGEFPNYGVGRTFRYKNHPFGTTVTVTRVRLKVRAVPSALPSVRIENSKGMWCDDICGQLHACGEPPAMWQHG